MLFHKCMLTLMNLNYILVTKALSEGLGKALLFSEALLAHTIKSYCCQQYTNVLHREEVWIGPWIKAAKRIALKVTGTPVHKFLLSNTQPVKTFFSMLLCNSEGSSKKSVKITLMMSSGWSLTDNLQQISKQTGGRWVWKMWAIIRQGGFH